MVIRKEEKQMHAGDMIVYIENPKDPSKNFQRQWGE
jgi:hypothetical protein